MSSAAAASHLGKPTGAPGGRPPEGFVSADWLHITDWHGSHRERRSERRFFGTRWIQIAYAAIDILCVTGIGVAAFFLRFSARDFRGLFSSRNVAAAAGQPLSRYGGFLFLYVVLILLFCEWQNLYRTPRTRTASEESIAVAKAVLFATLLLTAFLYLSGDRIVSRAIVLGSSAVNIAALAAWRYAKRCIVIYRIEKGITSRNVAIIGAGMIGQALARQLDENKHLGYSFKGFLDENHADDPRSLGRIEDLARVARAQFLDEVFITIPSERELVKRIAIESRHYRLDVKVVPELYDGLGWHAPLGHIGDFPVMDLHWQPIPTLGFFIKRVCDFSVAALALLLIAPALAVLAAWIACDSPGPIFYLSPRVGRKGRIFLCCKLRTMVANADELKDALRRQNERIGPFFKMEDDPRVTRLGKFLRKYSFDELPQFWNVLKGDMSLVGPRPHPLDDYKQYDLDHLRRLEVKPGITGLWQVKARRDPSFKTSMALDIEYIDRWSLLLDLKLVLETIPTVLKGMGQ